MWEFSTSLDKQTTGSSYMGNLIYVQHLHRYFVCLQEALGHAATLYQLIVAAAGANSTVDR